MDDRRRSPWPVLAIGLAVAACTAGAGGGTKPGPDPDPDPDPDPVRLAGDVSRCPAALRAALPAGQHGGFPSAGQTRSFVLILPPASFTGPRPLLVVYHGTGLSGAAVVDDYGLEGWAAKGFVVAAPDSNANGAFWPVWDAMHLPGAPPAENPDDVYFDDLVACVAGHHPVDAKRVFVAGHSAGGAMANHLLGHRAALLAGGITASGVFDLTQPAAPGPATPRTVIVTWGGDNDRYSGSAGDVVVQAVGFAEQAALASQHWEAAPQVRQLACEGNEVGHRWLLPLNGWLADVLLASPKGGAPAALPALPAGANAACAEAAATYVPPVQVACDPGAAAGCRAYCQLLGDCLAENGTFGAHASTALAALGFTATGDVCGGCITRCEADAAGSAPDATVLSCISAGSAQVTCGPGFQGMSAFGVMNACCEGAAGSQVCARYCGAFTPIEFFASQITACP